MGKICFGWVNFFNNHVEIVCISCPNILKMDDVWMGTMKSLGRKLISARDNAVPSAKYACFLQMDAKICMISLIIMFAAHSICVQDSIFKMSGTSPADACKYWSDWKSPNTDLTSSEILARSYDRDILWCPHYFSFVTSHQWIPLTKDQ